MSFINYSAYSAALIMSAQARATLLKLKEKPHADTGTIRIVKFAE